MHNLKPLNRVTIVHSGLSLVTEELAMHFAESVMNIEWDYNYYQPWSDNEWLVDEMLAMLDKDIIMQ